MRSAVDEEVPVARRLLMAERTAVAVIDIQQKLLPPIFNRSQVVHNSRLLLRLAAIVNLPVLATTQYAQALGGTVEEISGLLPAATPPLDKQVFSCFGSDEFCSLADGLGPGRSTLLLCGIEAHICVMQTALAALERGMSVHVAADAVGSRSEFNWKTGLRRMEAAGAVITSAESAIYELLRSSGSAAFKKMLPFLKEAATAKPV